MHLFTTRRRHRLVAVTGVATVAAALAITAAAAPDPVVGDDASSVASATPDQDPDAGRVVAAGQDVQAAAPTTTNVQGIDEFTAASRAASQEFVAAQAAERAAAEEAAAAQAAAEEAAAEQAAAEEAAAQAAAEEAAAEEAAAAEAAADAAAAEEAAAEEAAAEEAAADAAAAEQAAAAPAQGSHWDRLADCESGYRTGAGVPIDGSARWSYGLGAGENGMFEGGLQFHPGTWDSFRVDGMPGHAGEASRAQQIQVGERVQAAQGWGAWPNCSRIVGLR